MEWGSWGQEGGGGCGGGGGGGAERGKGWRRSVGPSGRELRAAGLDRQREQHHRVVRLGREGERCGAAIWDTMIEFRDKLGAR